MVTSSYPILPLLTRAGVLPAVLAALLAVAVPSAAGARTCAVEQVEGEDARLWQGGTWQALQAGPVPAEAIKIATGPGSRAEIVCDDGVVVTIGAATELNVEVLTSSSDAERGPANAVLQLIRGIVGLVTPDPGPRRLEVRTPLLIASVRSTEWLVEHGRDSSASAVFVREGRVVCRSHRRTISLMDGEGVTIVPGDGPPEPVKTWGQARIDRSTTALGFAWQ